MYKLIPKNKSLQQYFKSGETTSKQIVFRHGHIAITNYKLGDNKAFEKSLSVWDNMYFKYRLIGGYYVKFLKEFRINRGYNIKQLQDFFPDYEMIVDNDAYDSIDNESMELFTGPRSDFQRVALTFMASRDNFKQNRKYTQQIIDADTGDGKTYCGVAITAYMQKRAIITVPIKKLSGQWKESYIKFTSLTEDDIIIVKGSKMCEKLRLGEYADKSIFIFTVDTIASYHDRYGDANTIDMLNATGAFIKIVDEVHKDIKSMSMIEALSNFRLNFYMSASPGRSDSKENWIFKLLYFNVPRFGSNFKTDKEKHINIIIKKYFYLPDSTQTKRIINPRVGMNTMAYERELTHSSPKQKESFEISLLTMLKWSKGKVLEGNRILILAQTLEFLGYLYDLVNQIFPDVSLYHGGLKQKDKDKALESPVIVATSKSLGTGADIAGLQHVYNCGTYANWIDSMQLPGRLRKLNDGSESVYIELVNFGYRGTYRQFERRKKYLLNKSKNNKLLIIN